MQRPVQITYRNVPQSPAVSDLVRRKVASLERHGRVLLSGHVVIEAPPGNGPRRTRYRVTIEIRLPGEQIVVRRAPAAHKSHEDIETAVSMAFQAAQRKLEDHERRTRGRVKTHEEAHVDARVAKLFPHEGYGFLETSDGREVYFHRNAVVGRDFDQLVVGDAVRVVERADEDGIRATTVIPRGRQARKRAEIRGGRGRPIAPE